MCLFCDMIVLWIILYVINFYCSLMKLREWLKDDSFGLNLIIPQYLVVCDHDFCQRCLKQFIGKWYNGDKPAHDYSITCKIFLRFQTRPGRFVSCQSKSLYMHQIYFSHQCTNSLDSSPVIFIIFFNFCVQVRHYYYRLVRRINKLLAPGFSLDAKNSKDTIAAMLRW